MFKHTHTKVNIESIFFLRIHVKNHSCVHACLRYLFAFTYSDLFNDKNGENKRRNTYPYS